MSNRLGAALLVGAALLSACGDPTSPAPPPELVDATARAALLATRAASDTSFLETLRADSRAAGSGDLMRSLNYWSSDPDRFLVLADCVSARIEALAVPTGAE